ncbi:MAG: hypothetical protein HKN56_09340 [Gammaproteobacteria bacterium]|nr:hypothetical protein [Gammaproteobacteria bacterium]
MNSISLPPDDSSADAPAAAPAEEPAGRRDADRRPVTVNQPPEITGDAPVQATVGQPWAFEPDMSDADGDTLTVSASNLPGWLTLDSTTGQIAGTPTAADVQSWTGISLSVTDGNASVSLPTFTIAVVPANAATGSATLSWLPPTVTTDGEPIGELAGYRLLYGQNSLDYTQTIEIDNPGITRYMIEGLTAGNWYFAIQTIDGNGILSLPSAEAQKTI